MGSTRLPGKVLEDLGGRPVVAWTLEAAQEASSIDTVWLATSDLSSDDTLAAWAEAADWPVFRGSESDVLARFAGAAEASGADVVVRLTADCPFLAPDVIDAVVELLARTGADYASNTRVRRFPTGLDVEAFTRAALERADREAEEPFLREHVTPYLHGMRKAAFPWGGFAVTSLEHPHDFSHLRFTVDEPDDLAFARAVVAELGTSFAWMDVVALLTRKPDLLRINQGHLANEGSAAQIAAATGRRFARSAEALQRHEGKVFTAPRTAPAMLVRARGARVWDMDGNPHIDYMMGSGAVILGHRDPDVDAGIRSALDSGILAASPDLLEAEIADQLLRLMPSAQVAQFFRSVGDATAAVKRVVRSHTGRERVLSFGYGEVTSESADAFERVLVGHENGIAAVLVNMTADRPQGFLGRLRHLTDTAGIALVFDETSTAFRDALGGGQERCGIAPDLSILGPAMANGMAVSALAGRREILTINKALPAEPCCDRLALAAANETIRKLVREDVPARLSRLGQRLFQSFAGALTAAGLNEIILAGGEAWRPHVAFAAGPVAPSLLMRLFRQEMAAHGLLTGAHLHLSLAHDSPSIEQETEKAWRAALMALRDHLDAADPSSRLRPDVILPAQLQ